jgi:hypothetical protein
MSCILFTADTSILLQSGSHHRCRNIKSFSLCPVMSCVKSFSLDFLLLLDLCKGRTVPRASTPELLNFLWWCPIFVGPQYGASVMSQFGTVNFNLAPRFVENLCVTDVRL